MSSSVLLQTRDLSCMRNDRLLFEHLDIGLEAGQMLVVEGPNGCGKTSLLRILTGLRLADGGEVLWRGEPIDRLAGDYFEQVNYVGHHDGVKHELSCLENLRSFAHPSNKLCFLGSSARSAYFSKTCFFRLSKSSK